ncbi:hypothetical protein E2C01_072749 [Portunus trituberculatus]|uniref:Uncharacterized protein n=1 Tax=Portunus trituberculatus TaxID=210409 RepID=A0A5B7IC86_PORTR|nr:hypothetical protein [Portunus trituberculatus]
MCEGEARWRRGVVIAADLMGTTTTTTTTANATTTTATAIQKYNIIVSGAELIDTYSLEMRLN